MGFPRSYDDTKVDTISATARSIKESESIEAGGGGGGILLSFNFKKFSSFDSVCTNQANPRSLRKKAPPLCS